MWIARNANGWLKLYLTKPYRDFDDFGQEWASDDGYSLDLSKIRQNHEGNLYDISEDLIPGYESLKWKDEPIEVFLSIFNPYDAKYCIGTPIIEKTDADETDELKVIS